MEKLGMNENSLLQIIHFDDGKTNSTVLKKFDLSTEGYYEEVGDVLDLEKFNVFIEKKCLERIDRYMKEERHGLTVKDYLSNEPEKRIGAIFLDNVKKRLGKFGEAKNALVAANRVLLDFDDTDKRLIGLHLQRLGASSPEKLEAVLRGKSPERKVVRDKGKSKDDGRGGR